jgi:high-affinity iron transporter
VLVLVPVAAAAVVIVALPAAGSTTTGTAISITSGACAPGWHTAHSGAQTFTVDNQSSKAGEINLDNAGGDVVGEIETIGPATTADLSATLTSGTYTFRCLMSGRPVTASTTVQVTGGAAQQGPPAVRPITVAELTGPNDAYQRYAATDLTTTASDVATLRTDLAHGDLAAVRTDWLAAQLDWERVGASYDSFGDLGVAVDGLPDGLPNGVNDKNFAGLHRIEYGLWHGSQHGQQAAELLTVADTLATNVAAVRKNLTSDDLAGDPTQLPLRAHEIVEDALRDHLSAIDDDGAGAAYSMTYADTQVDKVVLGYLAKLIDERDPGLVATADRQLATLQSALLATRAGGQWQPLTEATAEQRQRVDASIGALLESLASVPDLLEVPVTH